MEEETRVLIEVRLERAQEDIETAKELLNMGRYRAAVNRSYYAILGVTTALSTRCLDGPNPICEFKIQGLPPRHYKGLSCI